MAYLLDVATGRYFPLAPHHTFGRLASAVNTLIDKPYASKLHAAVEWNGSQWRIKHLGLNGTWLNNLNLAQGEYTTLTEGDLIRIADVSDTGFRVINLAPPADILWPVNANDLEQHAPIVLDRFHLLPDTQTPEFALFYNEPEQQWYWESSGTESEARQEPIQHGQIIQLCGQPWQLLRAQLVGPTEARIPQAQKLDQLGFEFHLSLDEETTQLIIDQQGKRVDLGSRTHHYLMLQLARHRAQDIARGLDGSAQGWVYTAQLGSELGLDATHMNIQIFRARKQFADQLPHIRDQQSLLERLGNKIRFGGQHFCIYKGDKLVVSSNTDSPAHS